MQIAGLVGIVLVVLSVSRWGPAARLFRWLPVPLWCYLLPAIAITLGLLPRGHQGYPALTGALLPVALGLLSLGTDVPAILRTGGRALLAAAIGAAGIALGTAAWSWILRAFLPPDAWKGVGALTATWTGGTMNLLALRTLLEIPETMFASLILTDAAIAYSWMALLIGALGIQARMNRWLRASHTVHSERIPAINSAQLSVEKRLLAWSRCLLLAVALAIGARWMGSCLSPGLLVSSTTGWAVLLVTTGALALSCVPPVRRLGAVGGEVGYPCLYLVLAATGAQADLSALREAPVWLVLGVGSVLIHGGVLLAAGRLLRLPLGLLATVSQANLGGFVSAPLVGAAYHPTLAPIGLLLAMAGSAVGTYCGLLTASLSRLLLGGS